MDNNNLNNDGLEGASQRMQHSRETQARVYDQPSPVNNAEVEALASRMRHSPAMQAKAYEQLGAAEAQP